MTLSRVTKRKGGGVSAPPPPLLDTVKSLLTQPWFVGYRRGLFWHRWWHLVDIDESQRPKK